jgi:hypothetical protein
VLLDRFSQFDGAGTAFDYVEAIGRSRQPFCSLTVGAGACVAGPNGLAIGAFCWVDPNTGQASNTLVGNTMTASAAILEASDIVSGSGASSASGNASIAETADAISAAGVTSSGLLFGFVLPLENTYNLWERAFIRKELPFAQMIIRPGVECTISSQGAFRTKFPNGGSVGDRVYADPATGLPYSGPERASFIPTQWTLAQNGPPGARLLMSSFIKPFNQ